jgi:spermidine synthase
MKKYILLLATLSGTCGIAYEILYARMLSTYMGDMFYVAAATLTAFLLSLGIGSLIAQKWPRSLGFIEIAIGLYAILASYVFLNHGEDLVSWLVNTPLPTPLVLMSTVFAVLIIPAMMIGFSIPLFTLYANKHSTKKDKGSRFGWVYFSYNIGAALCVISIEYILLRAFGIANATIFIALINILIGFLVLRIPAPQKPAKLNLNIKVNKKIVALFVASFASGVLQLFYLKITNKVFGPFNENFAIVLTSALFGIALGSALVTTTKLKFQHILFIAGVLTTIIFASLGYSIRSWAYLNDTVTAMLGMTWLLKIGMILLLTLPPLVFIGGAIPALLKDKSIKISAGHALAISCFGNCTGFLAMLFFIHETLSDAHIAVFISVVLMLSALVFTRKDILAPVAVGVIATALCIPQFWPEKMIAIDFRKLAHIGGINSALETMKDAQTYKKLDSTIDLIKTDQNQTLYIINGYQSLAIGGLKKANLRELTFGMSPALFSRNHDNALVLGLGTGLTPAGTASVYKNVDVAEINPLVIEMIDIFKEENLSLSDKEYVNVKLQDGLIALMQEDNKKYDAIINTVTSPAYFSSAKLYTSNFFKLAAKKLKTGGVYSIWFDSRQTNRGVKIIFNSLKSAFKHCKPLHLTRQYHQVICSNDDLQLQKNIEISQEMRGFLATGLHIYIPIQSYLEGLVIHSHPRFQGKDITTTDWNAPLNTFNNPTLEFDISRNLFNRLLLEEERSVGMPEYENFHISPFDGHLFSPLELAHKCAAFTVIAQGGDSACFNHALFNDHPIDIDEYLFLSIGHFIRNNTYPQAIAGVYNMLDKHNKEFPEKTPIALPGKILPFMCMNNISDEHRGVFQYFYLNHLLDTKQNIPKVLLSQMLTSNAYPEAQLLAKNVARMLLVPVMQRKLDTKSNPCEGR